ncbi:hypothetical protein Q2T42_07995 [Leptolyngbya boryana CZ1]|uniref:Uncharacterized protein n=1 Tax=Leptolyngbya boryana CZ1 TaxID=3060204 RepID=A0AA96WZ26_LEPBY|nr:hypothetical protein [Leptolyngbya boryana]WNZ47773.1 hypothetical protein Q2T42_07995 [Leptolyngbya boryana CZ1]
MSKQSIWCDRSSQEARSRFNAATTIALLSNRINKKIFFST